MEYDDFKRGSVRRRVSHFSAAEYSQRRSQLQLMNMGTEPMALILSSPTNRQGTERTIGKRQSAILVMAIVAAGSVSAEKPEQSFDTLIVGGQIVDGSGAPAYMGDIGLRDGIIAVIGDLSDYEASTRIDASGKHIVPGFIDLHGHADDQQGAWRGMRSPDPIRRAAPAHVSQGITTSVTNSDGQASFLPVSEQMAAVEKQGGIGFNLAYMVAHSRIRYSALGDDSARIATSAEISIMQNLIKEDMESGAWGLATVLENSDGHWSSTEEFIETTLSLKPYDGVVIAHPRSMSQKPAWWLPSEAKDKVKNGYPMTLTMFEASEELIRVADENDIRVSISHMSVRGPDPDSDGLRTVQAVEKARKRGVKIFADMHVYEANPIGHFSPLLPKWALYEYPRGASFFSRPNEPRGELKYKAKLASILQDPANLAPLKQDIEYTIEFWGGADNIFITAYPDPDYIGRSLEELSEMLNEAPYLTVIRMGREGFSHHPGGMLAFGKFRTRENIKRFIKTDWVAGDTDGYTTLPFDPGYIHPRFYGAYPTWIRKDRKSVV